MQCICGLLRRPRLSVQLCRLCHSQRPTEDEKPTAAFEMRETLAKNKDIDEDQQRLLSHIDVSSDMEMLSRITDKLVFSAMRTEKQKQPINVETFAHLAHAWARRGRIEEVARLDRHLNNLRITPSLAFQTAGLHAVGVNFRVKSIHVDMLVGIASKILRDVVSTLPKRSTQDVIFSQLVWEVRQFGPAVVEAVTTAVRSVWPNAKLSFPTPSNQYHNHLLADLDSDQSAPQVNVNQKLFADSGGRELLLDAFQLQLDKELDQVCPVANLITNDNYLLPGELDQMKHSSAAHDRLMESLSKQIEDNFRTMRQNIEANEFGFRPSNVLSYFSAMPDSLYHQVILDEVKSLIKTSEGYSDSVRYIEMAIGRAVEQKFKIYRYQRVGIVDELRLIYKTFASQHLSQPQSAEANSRLFWLSQFSPVQLGFLERTCVVDWPKTIVKYVGYRIFSEVILKLKVDSHLMELFETFAKLGRSVSETVDFNEKRSWGFGVDVQRFDHHLFCQLARVRDGQTKNEVQCHPTVSALFSIERASQLHFPVKELPMVCPPLPWLSLHLGSLLITSVDLIRPMSADRIELTWMPPASTSTEDGRQKSAFKPPAQIEPRQIYPVLDSLTILGECAWIVNKPVLQVATEIFFNKGNFRLAVPPPVDVLDMVERPSRRQRKERLAYLKRRAEMFSLWCTELYRLSIAKQYSNQVFWTPHSLDFRGRAYPIGPHLSHMGNDLSRSLFAFAVGKSLGKTGLDWLKIHCINLTGLKKRESLNDRLNFANEMLYEIMDSARRPLTGWRWWQMSEEPFQTLACCLEIERALACADGPEAFVSCFPVHQDGSCNGLQHYAALGRDPGGASSVNLAPADRPQDVYSDMLALVEEQRQEDVANGAKIAQVLDGFVRRKVIKQTVMTTVYGVTMYGSWLQIRGQLEAIEQFPSKEHGQAAARYISDNIFRSLDKMFANTRIIQRWLTTLAQNISRLHQQPVAWVTPLGLPVIQPYFVKQRKRFKDISIPLNRNVSNTRKQANAFPPNYIHSLDSTHMMLTALRCHRDGLVFMSVHDSFWTHACDIDALNRHVRSQFVALHSEPLLERLAADMMAIYPRSSLPESTVSRLADKKVVADVDGFYKRLDSVPVKGDFDLNSVLRSVYFFS